MTKSRRTLKQAYQEPVVSELAEFVFGNSKEKPSPDNEQEHQDVAEEFGAEIIVHPSQIHKTFSFTPDKKPVRYYYDMEELRHWAETDLKPNGVRSPLWTRPVHGQPGQYELVAGLRRLTGCELVQITEVPIKVFDWTDAQAYAAAFDENDRRRNFSALEDVDITLNLLSIKLGKTREEVVSLLYRMDNAAKGKITQNILGNPDAQRVEGFFKSRDSLSWQSFVASRLPLLKKPADLLDAVRDSKIEYTKAIEIAKIKDPHERVDLLQRVIDQQLPLSAIKEQVKKKALESKSNEYLQGEQRDLKRRFQATLKRLDKSDVWASQVKADALTEILARLEQLMEE